MAACKHFTVQCTRYRQWLLLLLLLLLVSMCSCISPTSQLPPPHTPTGTAAAAPDSVILRAPAGNAAIGRSDMHAGVDKIRGAAYISSMSALLLRNHSYSDKDHEVMRRVNLSQRLSFLNASAPRAVLVHVHIQKASGTALAMTLSTACKCHSVQLVSPLGVHYSADHCRYCPKLHGYRGNSTMTINRLAGARWVCGIHPPLDVMQGCLRKKLGDPSPLLPRGDGRGTSTSEAKYTEQRLQPVFVVMLREPWARFMSEIKQSKEPKKSSKIVNGSTHVYTGIADWQASIPRVWSKVSGLTRLPDRYIVQNRHLKMIGGARGDFDMHEQAGSTDKKGNFTRWKGANSDAYKRQLLSTALVRLAQQKSILIGISEKFAESVCSLEVLFGHLYRFQWKEEVHSHNKHKDYSAGNVTVTATADDYALWRRINKYDLALYEAATVLFEVQFSEAMSLLRQRLQAGEVQEDRVPHCVPFLRGQA